MFNNSKKKLPPDAPPKAAEEKKAAWKGGTYNKVLHAIEPKANRSSVASDLFKKVKTEEVSTPETEENKATVRPEASRKK